MVVLGVSFGVIGTDIYTGVARFTFGYISLAEGLGLVAVAIGLFGVPEVISSIKGTRAARINPNTTTKW
jgi:TctA family transporter